MSIQALQQLRDSLAQLFQRDVHRQEEIAELRREIDKLKQQQPKVGRPPKQTE